MTEETPTVGVAADHEAIAYFSMEIGLEEGIPTYSGGLGMLAGDTARSAADLQVPMVVVSLLHRKGLLPPASGCRRGTNRRAGRMVACPMA